MVSSRPVFLSALTIRLHATGDESEGDFAAHEFTPRGRIQLRPCPDVHMNVGRHGSG